jgi:hypothetical protein
VIVRYFHKRRAVLRVLNGESREAVAADIGVPSSELDEWRRAYLAEELWKWPSLTVAVLFVIPAVSLVFAIASGDVIPPWAWFVLVAISLVLALAAVRATASRARPSDHLRELPNNSYPEADEPVAQFAVEVAVCVAAGAAIAAGAPLDLVAFAALGALTAVLVGFGIKELWRSDGG